MRETDIIITQIVSVTRDKLTVGKPYVPALARASHAIAFILEGSMAYEVDEKRSIVRQGELLFIHAGHVDRASVFECEQVHYITIDFKTLSDDFELATAISLSERRETVLRLYERILSVWLSGAPHRGMRCIELLYSILNSLPDNTYGEQALQMKYPKVANAILLLNNRYSDPQLSARDLAAACGMSESNLNRLMHALYDCTTTAYLRRTRIQHAMLLLANSANRVSEIAAAVGYADVYAFSHAFKLETGLSPSDWRLGKSGAASGKPPFSS